MAIDYFATNLKKKDSVEKCGNRAAQLIKEFQRAHMLVFIYLLCN